MGDFFGGLLGAAANLFGGLTGQQNQANINAQNIAAQLAFQQNGIQWRVADAKKAGINPLAALGAQTGSFSNVVGDNSLGTGIANAGQDLSRAINSMRSPEDKANAALKTKLDLDALALDNEHKKILIASDLAKANQPGTPPGVPTVNQRYGIPGQPQTILKGTGSSEGEPMVKMEPQKFNPPNPQAPGTEGASFPEISWGQNGTTYTPYPSEAFSKRTSNDTLSNWALTLRNRLMPVFGRRNIGPPFPAPDGSRWVANPDGSYELKQGRSTDRNYLSRGGYEEQ